METFKGRIIKRVKALLWSIAMMVVSVLIAVVAEDIQLLNLPPAVVVLLGLVLAQVSKYLNSRPELAQQ